MAKCIFCKKSHLKGKYRCEITGQIRTGECWSCNRAKPHCRYFKAKLINRFLEWLNEKF